MASANGRTEGENILQEADRLTGEGVRETEYGHPLDVYGHTAELWEAMFGWEADAEKVCTAMVLLKLAREHSKEKKDNLVDAAGYVRLIEKIQDERRRRMHADS